MSKEYKKLLSDLTTEDGRKAYYEYELMNRKTWFHHIAPHINPAFNAELLERYGVDAHGDQRFRFIWAGTLRATNFHFTGQETIPYDGMKYEFLKHRVVVGYTYFDAQGNTQTVRDRRLVPKGKMYLESTKLEGLGLMRFVLEAKYTYSEMVEMGYYPPAGTKAADNFCYKDGNRYRALDPRGEYRLCFPIVDGNNKYRDVNRADLEEVHRIVNEAKNETPAEYVERKQQEIATMVALQSQEERDRFNTQFDRAMVWAETEAIRGHVEFSKNV